MSFNYIQELEIPVVIIDNWVPFPNCIIPVEVSDDDSKNSIKEVIKGENKVYLVVNIDKNNENDSTEINKYGVVAEIKQYIEKPDKSYKTVFQALEKAELTEVFTKDKVVYSKVKTIDEGTFEINYGKELSLIMKETLIQTVKNLPDVWSNISGFDFDESLDLLLSKLCLVFRTKKENRINLLHTSTIEARYKLLLEYLSLELYMHTIREDVQRKVKEKLDKNHKEYVLREELSIIKKELGEDSLNDYEIYKEKLNSTNMSEELKDKVLVEIEKLKVQSTHSQESSIIKNYLDTVLDYPWGIYTKDNVELKNAKSVLEKEHYGLKKVKERILEFIAIKEFNSESKSPILCFIGPPGTGKTSIATSIAKALDRKIVRISLGGVKDEAEIRGHRRTYLGAMPGRIAKAMINAKCSNPIILLDEIDKVGADYKGDPSSALLEVLDAEQNINFRDNFLEVPIDLSTVLFITTANTVSTIPEPLRDRMDIIEINSYTDNEKLHIAKDYLYTKQLKEYGINKSQVSISEETLKIIIRQYLREAGVRQLERKIGELIRKGAKYILENNKKSVKISKRNIKDFLGNPKYPEDYIDKSNQIGIVHGLAWTSVGGCTLEIEVNCMPGSGKLDLTGQMGDVMKESARTAKTYIRSIAKDYDIDIKYFDNTDIHIHIPEGAVPKDGPSAGITMASAILSAVTLKPIKGNLCMTGEITLRGRVLAIGGLKEKLLAAKNANISNVIIPFENKRTVEEIEEEIKENLNIIFAKTMNDVIKEIFVKE